MVLELAPGDLPDWVQGVEQVHGVNTIWQNPSARRADAREARYFVQFYLIVASRFRSKTSFFAQKSQFSNWFGDPTWSVHLPTEVQWIYSLNRRLLPQMSLFEDVPPAPVAPAHNLKSY